MNEATRNDWKVSQLPNGYWQVQRPDGSAESNWQFFHDEKEAREFLFDHLRHMAIIKESQ